MNGESEERLKGCIRTLKQRLQVPEGADIREACPRPEGTEGVPHPKEGVTTSHRYARHRGHRIEIETSYTIKVDGRRVERHLAVDDDGSVHSHALPHGWYGSTIDLVRDLIDAYPERFAMPEDETSKTGGTK